MSTGAIDKEQEFVHDVYEQIASHFSDTRYKPWPVVETFLKSLPPGSIGLDVGCGNGKYLSVNKSVVILGSDRSSNLVDIAFNKHVNTSSGIDVMVADGLSLPFPHDSFDFAISIAVIHHFSTPERRIEAVREILLRLKPESHSKALIHVWALEQESSRRGYHEGMDQDVMVPWVTKQAQKKKKNTKTVESENLNEKIGSEPQEVVRHRYYHLYKKGELEKDVDLAGGKVIESGYSRDNWYAIISRDVL
ncbi:uncharacterized protein SAPINGB_P004647 [Magnusiomyces paraingens]|uniref:Methyltransferase type 11 domain-containing protein n=1 Tax=Magnusiomyces paraingens TaxID=2606893 RepID=A0A5E8BVN2_9ASCO|nr:uncharacterized protein SAPINGB_P004647 [Saprochaete ingens]VVT55552.1 unnamed protein product [Saprochaete ingens]